jgi:methyl-accepting chemotaxis protein
MNAAIEAAHAGEAGKGFAVVADEVRKLADQSNEEARKVKTLLGDVGSVSQGAQKELSATQTTFDQIVKGTRDVGEVVRQVRRAMEEQNLANQEMVKAVGEIVSTTETARSTGEGVGESTQVMALAAADLSGKTEAFKAALASLKNLSHQISKSMDGVEGGVKAIGEGSAGVELVVVRQNQSMEHLAELVGRFQVGTTPAAIGHSKG